VKERRFLRLALDAFFDGSARLAGALVSLAHF
jgi:hypothetical protein